MSRIEGHRLERKLFPCQRLKVTVHYDSQMKLMEFHIPSGSRKAITWGLELDCITTEIACGCEDREYRTETKKARDYQHLIEKLAWEKHHKRFKPSVLRPDKGLCPHARKVKAYLKRRPEVWQAMNAIANAWIEDLLQRPDWTPEREAA